MKAPPEIGMDHLTMLDVSPPDLVMVAGGAGFDSVSLRVAASTPGEDPWPMEPGSRMLGETARRLEDTGVRALSVEVLRITPETTREDYEPAFEAAAALGARYATVNVDDPDIGRTSETFAAMVADARPYGVRPLVEPIVYTRLSNLEDALHVAERSGGGGVLLDSLHFQRYGGDLEKIRSLDPDLLSYVQLCDAPLAPPEGLPRPARMPRGQSTDGTDLQLESRAMRLLPGDGGLPLVQFLAALPEDIPVSVEAPVLSLWESLTPAEFARRARRAVEGVVAAARVSTETKERP